MNTSIALPSPSPASLGFDNADTFALLQRAAKLLSSSTLVPAQYRSIKEKKEFGKVVGFEDNPNALANCVIALNIARRMRADELMVMQNLYVVEGRPAWSAQWVIAAVNTCGKFSPLRFDISDLGVRDFTYSVTEWVEGKRQTRQCQARINNLQCVAWATEKTTGERVESPPVTMEMAVAEGWYGKTASKWQTMPQVMLRYRAASFFGKLYAPELLMGLPTAEEVYDMPPEERAATGRVLDSVPDALSGASKSFLPSVAATAAALVETSETERQETISGARPAATATTGPGESASDAAHAPNSSAGDPAGAEPGQKAQAKAAPPKTSSPPAPAEQLAPAAANPPAGSAPGGGDPPFDPKKEIQKRLAGRGYTPGDFAVVARELSLTKGKFSGMTPEELESALERWDEVEIGLGNLIT